MPIYKNEHFNDKRSTYVNNICTVDLLSPTWMAINTSCIRNYNSDFYLFANNVFSFHKFIYSF